MAESESIPLSEQMAGRVMRLNDLRRETLLKINLGMNEISGIGRELVGKRRAFMVKAKVDGDSDSLKKYFPEGLLLVIVLDEAVSELGVEQLRVGYTGVGYTDPGHLAEGFELIDICDNGGRTLIRGEMDLASGEVKFINGEEKYQSNKAGERVGILVKESRYSKERNDGLPFVVKDLTDRNFEEIVDQGTGKLWSEEKCKRIDEQRRKAVLGNLLVLDEVDNSAVDSWVSLLRDGDPGDFFNQVWQLVEGLEAVEGSKGGVGDRKGKLSQGGAEVLVKRKIEQILGYIDKLPNIGKLPNIAKGGIELYVETDLAYGIKDKRLTYLFNTPRKSEPGYLVIKLGYDNQRFENPLEIDVMAVSGEVGSLQIEEEALIENEDLNLARVLSLLGRREE